MARRNNIFKRGKSWYVRFQKDGKEVWRSAGRSRQAAQELLIKVRADAERDALGLPQKPKAAKTLAEWEPVYMEWAKVHKRSWERDERSLKVLVPALGNLRLTEITKPRVEAYMRDRVECVSGPSVNREVACLRKLLSHAVEAGEIESNQLLGIRMFAESPARIPTLEPADERKLIDAARPWLQLAIRIAIATGCRQGEILALRWRHVDFDNGVVVVADSKSNDARRVPLHPTLRDDLRRVRGLPEGYVVSLPNGRSPSRHSVHNAFKKAVAAIGRPDFRFHDLRHICGSRLLATGASLPEVAAVLGHKTLHMAARYAHVSWTRLSALVASMPVDAGSAPN